ncbi:hypothetical protein EV360DRAFT_76945 [Lentinula raphanica]|nr:hypothetical protein EV360DRAFT_76945 [Lentinula raphanica]
MLKRRSARLDPTAASEGNNAKRRKENDVGDDLKPRPTLSRQSKGKNSTSGSKAKSSARPASKSSTGAAGRAPTKTQKDPISSKTNYMDTLDEVAPPIEVSISKKGIALNNEEKQADLGDDVVEILDSEDDNKNEGIQNLSEEEEEADAGYLSEIDFFREGEGETAKWDDNMKVEDITKSVQKRRRSEGATASSSASSRTKGKILETDFEDVELAHLAKSSVRLAICIDDMWPQGDKPSLKLLRQELGKMKNKDLLISLQKLTQSPQEKDKLIRFMNYASSQVRFDISVPTRLLVAEYFQLSGGKGQPGLEEVAARANWLLKDQRYHEKVDLENLTSDKNPFTSPLIGKILRVHFVDSASYQDKFLRKRFKTTKQIPPRLIVLIATLIDHAISEWISGTRIVIYLTRANVVMRYCNILRTMAITEKESPDYVKMISKSLYTELRSRDFGLDQEAPKYDYAKLTAYTQEELKRLESLEEEEDISDIEDTDLESEGGDKVELVPVMPQAHVREVVVMLALEGLETEAGTAKEEEGSRLKRAMARARAKRDNSEEDSAIAS